MFKKMYYDIGACGMKYDGIKVMCRGLWSEKFNYLWFDLSKNKNEGKYRFFNECKNTSTDCISENEAFKIPKCCFQLKTDRN